MIFTHDSSMDLSGWNLVYAAIYPATTVVGLVCLAQGVHRIGATKAAIINMLEPAVSMVVSVLVLGGSEVTVLSLIGCGLILTSVVVVTLTKGEKGETPVKQGESGGKGGG